MSFLLQTVLFLGGAVLLVPLFHKLKLGSVLGYLTAGILIGPSALGLVSDVDAILHFSELGVVLLLFIIGLELKPSRLWVLRRPVFGLGTAQVVLTGIVLSFFGGLLGLDATLACVIGFGLALSSTAFVLQTLAEKGEMTTQHGRSAFAVLLFQDLAVIPMLAVLPVLAPGSGSEQVDLPFAVAKVVGVFAFVVLNEGATASEELRAELVKTVRKEIGPIATPDVVRFAPGLPKTRSGKIMRRILRKIAENDYGNLGDTSTLAEPEVVDDLVENRLNR